MRMLLSPETFTWLGSAFSEKTKISPFSVIQAPGFSEGDKAALHEQGVIDGDSALSPESYALFDILARARAFASFRLSGAFGSVEKTAYFHEDAQATVDNAGQGLVISGAVDLDTMAGVINEITGISRLVNAKVNLKMGPKSALAFAALLDLTRKYALGQYAGLTSLPAGFPELEIVAMANGAADQHWLTSYLKTFRLPDLSLTEDELAVAFSGLLAANMVESGDYGYRLIGEAYDLAVNFLIIEHVLHVRCGREQDGEILIGEGLFLQAGLHDVLMLDVDLETVEFNTVSTQTMVEYLQTMVSQAPDFS